ncbi:MAG: methyltransferase domain-containing protein [Pseudomonadota bacterium]
MTKNVANHYTSGDLFDRIMAALKDDGADPDQPTIAALAPYDQFHGRGLEATEDVASLLSLMASDHVLDVGSGIGGPARFMADRFGCRVTGIDLTPVFCDVARWLTTRLGMDDRVSIEIGDALAMPFADASFDAAYSMNVSMNIADKDGLYAELARVLKPGARLVLSEFARGDGPEPEYPLPWARTAETSILATFEATRSGLEGAGFVIVQARDTAAESKDFGARSKALVERGKKPPHRSVPLVHGEAAAVMMANSSRAVAEGRILPIEILARKRD